MYTKPYIFIDLLKIWKYNHFNESDFEGIVCMWQTLQCDEIVFLTVFYENGFDSLYSNHLGIQRIELRKNERKRTRDYSQWRNTKIFI